MIKCLRVPLRLHGEQHFVLQDRTNQRVHLKIKSVLRLINKSAQLIKKKMRARKVVKSTFTDYRDIIAFSSGNRIHLEGFFFDSPV